MANLPEEAMDALDRELAKEEYLPEGLDTTRPMAEVIDRRVGPWPLKIPLEVPGNPIGALQTRQPTQEELSRALEWAHKHPEVIQYPFEAHTDKVDERGDDDDFADARQMFGPAPPAAKKQLPEPKPPQGFSKPVGNRAIPSLSTERGGAQHPPLLSGEVTPPIPHFDAKKAAKKAGPVSGLFAPMLHIVEALSYPDPIDYLAGWGGTRFVKGGRNVQAQREIDKLDQEIAKFEKDSAAPVSEPPAAETPPEPPKAQPPESPPPIAEDRALVPAGQRLPAAQKPGGLPEGPGKTEPRSEDGTTYWFDPDSPYFMVDLTKPVKEQSDAYTWKWAKRLFPADWGIARRQPESPVIGILDRPAAWLSNWADSFMTRKLDDSTSELELEVREALSKITDPNLLYDAQAYVHAAWAQTRRRAAQGTQMTGDLESGITGGPGFHGAGSYEDAWRRGFQGPLRPGEVPKGPKRAPRAKRIPPTKSSQIGPEPSMDDPRYAEWAFDEIVNSLPPEFEEVKPFFRLFQERLKIEQRARATLGLDPIERVPFPYLPQLTKENADLLIRLQRGESGAVGELRQTIGAFQNSRTYATPHDGMLGIIRDNDGNIIARNGIPQQYEDPKRAMMLRLLLSKQLEATANMMEELSGKVIFNTYEEAVAAGLARKWTVKVPPPGKRPPSDAGDRAVAPFGEHLKDQWKPPQPEVVRVTGLPGPANKVWYVPSREEANALRQHMTPGSGGAFRIGRVLNYFFRNPNLWVPYPHFVKNMGYKYVMAMGAMDNPLLALPRSWARWLEILESVPQAHASRAIPAVGRLSRDMAEFLHDLNPVMKSEFLQVMPFTKTGKSSYDSLATLIESDPVWRTTHVIGQHFSGNAWSSRVIFSKMDPAMKYSLWKRYREKGLSADAAANQVNIDLIRYTMKGEILDFWKSVPLNFFVPWRYGTVMATAKQFSTDPTGVTSSTARIASQIGSLPVRAATLPAYMLTRPFKSALLLGAFMWMREAYYRRTGNAFHAPIDYINTPMAELVSDPTNLHLYLNFLASNSTLGPGGHIQRLLDEADAIGKVFTGDPEGFERIKNIYWGIAQVYDTVDDFKRWQDGGFQDWKIPLHILMRAATAEHQSYREGIPGKAKRLESVLIPENMPVTNPEVQSRREQAEGRQRRYERAKERGKRRSERRRERERDRPLP